VTLELTTTDGFSSQETMPGWSIVADLTPPELIQLRWIAVLRRRIGIGLALVLVLCLLAYAYAVVQHRAAEKDAAAVAQRTAILTRSANQFAGITLIESTVAGVDGQVACVMQDDVDVARVVASIDQALPSSMSIQSISVTLTPDASADPSAGLTATGRPAIGAVTVSGSGRGLDDLPAFVDGLTAVRGFTDVLPTSNQVSGGVAQFSLTIDLTDQLYSHLFDVGKPGGG
jgi:hypothetical protein